MFQSRAQYVIYFLFLACCLRTAAAEQISGPIDADIVRVIDGDTILVEARPWPDHKISTYVRLRGIDAPELKSDCESFRVLARRAQDELTAILTGQDHVSLTAISGDKYFGRVVAELRLPDGRRPADILLNSGLATPYDGRAKSAKTCPD